MNRILYKNSLKNISVSDYTIDQLVSKVNRLEKASPCKKNYLKIMLPLAVLLVASVLTVSAAPGLSISDSFKAFFSQFFGTEMSDRQLSILEKYGSTPNISYNRDGTEFTIDGVIGDENLLYIKYSVTTQKENDTISYYSITSPRLFIGDLKKRIQPQSISKTSIQDKTDPYKYDYAAIFNFEQDITASDKTATFVMKFPGKYQPAGIDLGNAYATSGVSPVNSNDIYSIPNSKLGISFDNKYGKILLESIGYANGQLILAVDPSGYYDLPELYLRDKKTKEIYSRCDKFFSVKNRDNLEIYPYRVNSINMLKDLEIVMLDEFHLSFPLSYANKTKTIDLSKKNISVHNNTRLDKIKLSPLSLTIYGTAAAGYSSSFSNNDCSLRLKDSSVLDTFKFGGSSSGNSDGSFSINIPFEAPLEIEEVDALIIKSVYDEKAVEIPLN